MHSRPRIGTLAAALAAIGLGISACAPSEKTSAEADKAPSATPATPEPAPAPDPADPFAYAVPFECEAGGEISVLFQNGDSQSVRVRAGSGEYTLALDSNQQEMIYTNGSQTLTLRGGDALYAAGGAAPTACRAVIRDLPPPTVDGVVRDLKASDAGAEVTLNIGQRLSISLSGVPTAGYMWAPQDAPAFLEKVAETGGPTSSAQLMPGFAGGNHWEVTVFEAKAPGEAELTMVQRRPWEDKAEPDAATFKVKVKVQ